LLTALGRPPPARQIPEYCPDGVTEDTVAENCFDLLFAFDEIVALGYRENVNMSQIRTYLEMHSHEETMHKIEQDRLKNNADQAKAAAMKRIDREKRSGGLGGDMPSMQSFVKAAQDLSDAPEFKDPEPVITTTTTRAEVKKTRKKGKGLSLKPRGTAKKDDLFAEALAKDGVAVESYEANDEAPAGLSSRASTGAESVAEVDQKGVHIKVEEKITLEATRDGDIESMEVKGFVFATVNDAAFNKIKITSSSNGDKAVSFQTHPNVDKKAWSKDKTIVLKNNKPYPDGTEVGVLKWKFRTDDESMIPLTVTCWPTVNPGGSSEVNVDYELQDTDLTLTNVSIVIPVPGAPVIGSAEGDTHYDKRNGVLEWNLDLIDADNAEGSLEFKVDASDNDEFFPVSCNFTSETTWAGFAVDSVEQEGADVDYSSEVSFGVESYEYV